jgi:hypothetical protein
MLTVPATRKHFYRQVTQPSRRKFPTAKSVSNQPALWTPDRFRHILALPLVRRFPADCAPLSPCWICDRKSGSGAGYHFGFPSANYHSTSDPCSSIIRGWYSRPIWDHSIKWLGLIPHQLKMVSILYCLIFILPQINRHQHVMDTCASASILLLSSL